jgi:hypothetical protein
MVAIGYQQHIQEHILNVGAGVMAPAPHYKIQIASVKTNYHHVLFKQK